MIVYLWYINAEWRTLMKEIKTVNIIGLGALGMLYGKCMMDALGYDNVKFIMNNDRIAKYKDTEYTCNGDVCKFHLESEDDATPADLVVVAIKSPAMESALKTMESSVGPDTVIMSVMNGISSERILAEKFGEEKLIYTVAQGMDATKLGPALTFSKAGELHIGIIDSGKQENLDAVAALLKASNLDYVLEDDILFRMWSKFMLNVGINQTCMVYGTTYSGALNVPEYFTTFISAMREVVAVANAEGIALSEKDLNQYVAIIRTLKPDLMPSMAQDRINKNPCEVDSFSGALMELAKKHEIYVPTNEFLNRRAKEIEKEYV